MQSRLTDKDQDGMAKSWSWRLQAACRSEDTSLFFPADGERPGAKARREAKAKLICAACPVAAECAAYALGTHERWGVWGGLSQEEREAVWQRQEPRLALVDTFTVQAVGL
ncbi:MAG TPA: WhiB family transcriptional regulator [Actinomycetota bacterium]|nr:WhiB family transcriptional regulator [Actinomycetota bacterium]